MARGRTDIVLADFGMDPEGRRTRLKRIGLVILSAWKAKANGHSPRMLSAYKKALTVQQDDRSVTVIFGQEGDKDLKLALMVEFGMGPGGIGTEGAYDVRKFLLSGGKGKMRMGPSGPYKVVPFTHTMKQIASMGGKDMAARVANDNFKASVDAGKQKTAWGSRIRASDLPGPLRAGNATKVDVTGKTYTAFRHKAHKLASLTKHKATYSKGVAQSSGGKTFRTASWAGDPWMHPGMKANHYGDQVRAELSVLLDGVI